MVAHDLDLMGGIMRRRASILARGMLRCVSDWKALFIVRNYGMLYEYGWWHSHKKKAAIDNLGQPIPWYTYPCLEFIENRLHERFEVFEYGCGNSTLWWAARVNNVISCEHDREWYEKVNRRIPENVSLSYQELVYGGEYCQVIGQYRDQFDVVVVDGRDRVRCVKNCLNALKSDGIIVWDNTEREEYSEGFDYLDTAGFKRLDFWGIGPIDISKWCTTIFYRRGNCLNI